MHLSYDEFVDRLNSKIVNGEEFYINLLKVIIDNPTRYTGIFRVSSAKTKLIQNVTQSNEIKFGDFIEDIVTEYISLLGYTNLTKLVGESSSGDRLNADQLFTSADNQFLYLIEQKIRDDHDSTKKRGQFNNFIYKVEFLKEQYSNHKLFAIMWFVDDSLRKNKNYYANEITAYMDLHHDITLRLYYGKELFSDLFERDDAWFEITHYLRKNKQARSKELLYIPDFDTSTEIRNALKQLPQRYKTKLMSNNEKYVQLRAELFPSGKNLSDL